MSDSNKLPWIDEVLNLYMKKTWENTFPNNDFTTIFVAIFHIIGFLFIHLGLFAPPYLLGWYILYLIIIKVSYYIFDNNCFMTLFANTAETKHQIPLSIRGTTAGNGLLIYLIISVIGFLFPKYSLFNIIKNTFLLLE